MTRAVFCVAVWLLALFPVPASAGASEANAPVRMQVKSVAVDPTSQTPVVILENTQEKKILPIWIGNAEATSIAMELEHVGIPRPNTHDLIRNLLQGLGVTLHRITITDLRNSTYYALLTLKLKGQEFQIDSRPSDAIAVALRMSAPIFVNPEVLAKARQLPAPTKQKEGIRKILGIHTQDLTPELASLLDLQAVKNGVLVADVELGSPASQAGIHRGDIILKVNDKAIQKVADLEALLQGVKKDSQVKMEVSRKGKPATVVLNLAAQGS